jgi:sugar/nucleoside kinase (ribokinase family)
VILVVGDLVTDVLVGHDGPIEVGSDTEARITVAGGGQAANTAAWLASAGSPVALIASVGDDAAGRERVAEMAASGVRCAVHVDPFLSTGSVVVLASAGERTMITDRGASGALPASFVRTAMSDFPDARHLHLSGYPLLHAGSRPAGLAALAEARSRGLTTSVDAASAAPLRSVGAAAFRSWIGGVDLLLVNADEAAVLAGPGAPSAQAAALTATARIVVVKQGAAGAVWHGPGGGPVSFRGTPTASVDPTGAGDAFAAVLLASWLSGTTPAAALAAGHAAGASAVSRPGARPPR